MLRKNGYIDYLINFSSSDQFLPILKGAGGGGVFQNKSDFIKSKIDIFKNNIEGFKQFYNSTTLLHENVGKPTNG